MRSSLDRAVRDNDLVYSSPVPPANQLVPIVGVSMVKLATPSEIEEPVAWLMGGTAGMGPLFSALVPYGVHLALSELLNRITRGFNVLIGIYDDRKDTKLRELEGRREELDGLAARCANRCLWSESCPYGAQYTAVSKSPRFDTGARQAYGTATIASSKGGGNR